MQKKKFNLKITCNGVFDDQLLVEYGIADVSAVTGVPKELIVYILETALVDYCYKNNLSIQDSIYNIKKEYKVYKKGYKDNAND